MESAVPLSPVAQASYPLDLIDTWGMVHNKKVTVKIEKLDSHQLRIIQGKKDSESSGDMISSGHISVVNGETYFNNRNGTKNRYEIYKFTRPCPDLILLYLPNPELIDADLKSGRVKGRIVQDFFTSRIFEEDREGLIKYINSYRGKLFAPFRYMVRSSKAGKLPEECKLIKYPGVPIGEKEEKQ